MLRGAVGRQQKAASRSCHLLMFTVGGRRLAVKTEEIGGISAWKGSFPIPSLTPFVSAVVRQDRGVFPVFDLAQLLRVTVQGEQALCLLAKQPGGAMAICIDEEMPSLHMPDTGTVHPYRGQDVPAVESVFVGFEEVPIISLARLGNA
ncbi:MAG: chemotaxis protein CheW [Nitrospira sp.]|jgi:chemotaxis signal transduction protein|nr:chemotaxis protein CheW [Nitrospira sp.]